MRYDSFRPGKQWLDTDGRPIQAHGFSVFYDANTGEYYWYGENKGRTTGGLRNTVWHWGVRCYASKDLYNWEDRGLLIPPEPGNLNSPLHPTYAVDRPHIIYCEKTQKYVAWLKVMAGPTSQFMTVMQADTFMGPYEMVHEVYKPNGMDSGDFTLVADEYTGEGYLIHERPHFELICATLNDTYTEVTGVYSRHFKDMLPPYTREAPTYFTRNGRRYLFTSGTSMYYPNPSKVACFTDFHGVYEDLGDPCIGDKSHTTFHSQITCVLNVPGTELYIAMADRWKPGILQQQMSPLAVFGVKQFFKKYVPDETPKEAEPVSGKLSRHMENTSRARYVWLPVEWKEDRPLLRWRDEWRIEDYL